MSSAKVGLGFKLESLRLLILRGVTGIDLPVVMTIATSKAIASSGR